jgi:hypothetical protein
MFRRTQTSLLSVMAGIFFAAVSLLPASASAAGDQLVANASSPADALGILLASAGSALVLLGFCGRLFLRRDQSSTPEYPAPLHFAGLANTSENRIRANAPGDAAAERDFYGMPSAALQARGSVASEPVATPLFTPAKNRPSISSSAVHQSQRLARTAVE